MHLAIIQLITKQISKLNRNKHIQYNSCKIYYNTGCIKCYECKMIFLWYKSTTPLTCGLCLCDLLGMSGRCFPFFLVDFSSFICPIFLFSLSSFDKYRCAFDFRFALVVVVSLLWLSVSLLPELFRLQSDLVISGRTEIQRQSCYQCNNDISSSSTSFCYFSPAIMWYCPHVLLYVTHYDVIMV